jgi:hypothetical protein
VGHDFSPQVHQAAAVITYFTPGLRFFHEGQLEGRCPEEPVDPVLQEFYRKLLDCLKRPEVRHGSWQLLEVRSVWEWNPTWERFLAYAWEEESGQRFLIAVNYGPTQGQCYVRLPFDDLRGDKVVLQDLLSDAQYEREGDDMSDRGLFLDLPAWGFHFFAC